MKITFVLPVLNFGEDFKRSYKFLEPLIYDGGCELLVVHPNSSDDNFKQFIDEMVEIPIGLNFLEIPKNGIYDAMNKGMLSAKGEWICFMGEGDLIFASEIKKLIDEGFLNNPSNEIIFCNVLSDGKKRVSINWNINAYSLDRLCTSHSVGMFIPKNLHKKIGLYDLNFKINADYDFFMRAIGANITARVIDILSGYWPSGGASTKQSYAVKLKEFNKIKIKNKAPLHSIILGTVFGFIFYIFIPILKDILLKIKARFGF